MPHVLGGLSNGERNETAQSIADYLSSLGEESFVADAIDQEAASRGKETFHQVGCVACHDPESKQLAGSVPLQQLEQKYGVMSLAAFLENPLSVRPGGRMPDLQLDHWQAVDIAHYLLRKQDRLSAVPIEFPHAAKGKTAFEKHGCVQCHRPNDAKSDMAPSLSDLQSPSCASVSYGLSATQERQIATALEEIGKENTPESQIRLHMARLNCIACHKRGDFGGHQMERDDFFTTSNLNLGEQARIPPALDQPGAKLQAKALRKILVNGASARPYMHTKMPRFGAQNVNELIDLFVATDSLEQAQWKSVTDQRAARDAGFQLAGDKNLGCVACHTFKGKSATTLQATELTTMTQRLHENWFHLYMRSPQRFHPTTIMPSFWPNNKSVRPEVLDGDPGMQINALWQYLSRGREARTPSGIRREPIYYGPDKWRSSPVAAPIPGHRQTRHRRRLSSRYQPVIRCVATAHRLHLERRICRDVRSLAGPGIGQRG